MREPPPYEQLINSLVFELFFPEELHRADVRLFDVCEQAGLCRLAPLGGQELATAASELAGQIFDKSHPIYAMLFDLQGLEVVRMIEGRD